MTTYVLKWNPREWPENEFLDYVARARGGEDLKFSCGTTKKISAGDSFFLMKVGKGYRGIIGAGQVVSAVYEDEHFNEERRRAGELARYCNVRFDYLGDPREALPIPRELLDTPDLQCTTWNTEGSGKSLPDEIAARVKSLFDDRIGRADFRVADEVWPDVGLPEGAVITVVVNRYERNGEARRICLEHHGYDCKVCGMNFWLRYGEIGRHYIHVHHIVPLASLREEYEVDPIRDLVPVCPNCHAMLHAGGSEALSVEGLRSQYSSYNQK